MALTERQVNRIINRIENALDELEADATFDFGNVRVRILEPRVEDDFVAVRFRLTADEEDRRGVQRLLNEIKVALDGPVDEDNPRIRFDDDTPDTPSRITDTFRLRFNEGSGFDFSDI